MSPEQYSKIEPKKEKDMIFDLNLKELKFNYDKIPDQIKY
jgi:hypothetical protein